MDIEEGEKVREYTEFESKTLDLLFNTLEGIIKIVQDGTRTDRERLEKILSFIDGVTSDPLGILGVDCNG
jgi:hypothetical protein